nr:HD domain-containing protein [Rhodohalobacter mucosus]
MEFLRQAEKLKITYRSGYTSDGRTESVAEHTWRLCLVALALEKHFPDVDMGRVIRICIIHDLGEALHGDIPAPEQEGSPEKSENERNDFRELIASLSESHKEEMLALWDEYENASTPEAKTAKALDKLETLLQHNQGQNPDSFDYAFNLDYGKKYTKGHPVIKAIRKHLARETKEKARGMNNK